MYCVCVCSASGSNQSFVSKGASKKAVTIPLTAEEVISLGLIHGALSWLSLLFLVVLQFLDVDLVFQLKNAFDHLFEGLMESKDGEKEAAEVRVSCLALSCLPWLCLRRHCELPSCFCRPWALPSCLTRSRRSPGCALGRTHRDSHPSGRRGASCTTTASRVSLPKKYQTGFTGESWRTTWGW